MILWQVSMNDPDNGHEIAIPNPVFRTREEAENYVESEITKDYEIEGHLRKYRGIWRASLVTGSEDIEWTEYSLFETTGDEIDAYVLQTHVD